MGELSFTQCNYPTPCTEGWINKDFMKECCIKLVLVNFQPDSGSIKSKCTLSKKLASRQTTHLENQQTVTFSVETGNFLCLCFGVLNMAHI